jgi:hypothetical protein
LTIGAAPRQTEVEDLRVCDVVGHEKQICGLDVAMTDVAQRGKRQPGHQAPRERQHFADRPLAGAVCVDSLAREPLHHEVLTPIVCEPVRDVANDRGMRQLRKHCDFSLEALLRDLVACMQQLDRDQTVGAQITALEDRTRSTFAHLAQELEAARSEAQHRHDYKGRGSGSEATSTKQLQLSAASAL